MATKEEIEGTKQIVDNIVTKFILIDKRSPLGPLGMKYRAHISELSKWQDDFKEALVNAFAGKDYKLDKSA